MIKYITDFPKHITDSLENSKNIVFKNDYSSVRSLLFSGMGGSGFLSNLITDITESNIKVPINYVKGYTLPAFIDKNTLPILISYSGNTEETLSCFYQAIEKKTTPIIITSGGKLKELALEHNLDLVEMPKGFPPRASLGYGAIKVLLVLQKLNLISINSENELSSIATFLSKKQNNIKEHTKEVASLYRNKLIIAYSENTIDSIGLRLQQQINENAKSLCWHNSIPEMNHNEIVGWKQKQHDLGVIFLRHSFEHERNKLRFNFTRDVVNEYAKKIIEIQAEGESFLEQYFYLTHWADYFSYYLSVEHGEDSIEINVIDKLKNYLSNTK